MKNNKKINILSLIGIVVTSTFGFTNIVLNYSQYGLNVTSLWLIVTLSFFLPLVLLMAELALINEKSESGIYGWIKQGTNSKIAFYGSWSFFIMNIFYLPVLAGRIPAFLSYFVYGKNIFLSGSATQNALLIIIVLIITHFLIIKGEKIFNYLTEFSGFIVLFLGIGFIIMAFLIPVFFPNINNSENSFKLVDFIPKFSPSFLTSYAWLVFAVSGSETIGPYVTKVENPKKKFPKAIFISALIIGISYILGTIAISFLSHSDILKNYKSMGYSANDVILLSYQELGNIYKLGIIFVKIIGFLYALTTMVAMVIWSIANVNSMFSEIPKEYLGKWLIKKKNDKLENAYLFQTILIILLVILQNLFGAGAKDIYFLMYDMTTMATIIPYMMLAISYIGVKKRKIDSKYKILNNDKAGLVIGYLVLAQTIIALIFSAYDPSQSFKENIPTMTLYYGGFLFFIFVGGLIKWFNNKNK